MLLAVTTTLRTRNAAWVLFRAASSIYCEATKRGGLDEEARVHRRRDDGTLRSRAAGAGHHVRTLRRRSPSERRLDGRPRRPRRVVPGLQRRAHRAEGVP